MKRDWFYDARGKRRTIWRRTGQGRIDWREYDEADYPRRPPGETEDWEPEMLRYRQLWGPSEFFCSNPDCCTPMLLSVRTGPPVCDACAMDKRASRAGAKMHGQRQIRFWQESGVWRWGLRCWSGRHGRPGWTGHGHHVADMDEMAPCCRLVLVFPSAARFALPPNPVPRPPDPRP